jgi:hypothetical protein
MGARAGHEDGALRVCGGTGEGVAPVSLIDRHEEPRRGLLARGDEERLLRLALEGGEGGDPRRC